MRKIIYHNSIGRIVRVVSSQTADPSAFGDELHIITDTDDDVTGHTHWVVGEEIVELPPRPSRNHIFYPGTWEWVDSRTPAQELIDERTVQEKVLSDWTSGVAYRLMGATPEVVTASWAEKLAQARKVLSGEESLVIDVEAAIRGISSQDMAAKIIQKAETHAKVAAIISGTTSVVRSLIEQSTDVDLMRSSVSTALSNADSMIDRTIK